MPKNRETFSSPDIQKPEGQKSRPLQRLFQKISDGKEKRARAKEKSIDKRLDPELENVLPSKRNIFGKREVQASLDTRPSAQAEKPIQKGRGNFQKQLDIDLGSVFPRSTNSSS